MNRVLAAATEVVRANRRFRLNVWTALLVGPGALVAFVVVGRRYPGPETTLLLAPPAVREDEEATETAP